MADDPPEEESGEAEPARSRALVQPLLEVPSIRFDQGFAILLMVVVGWQVVAARDFSPEGRLFVWVIGIPTFLMAALVLLSQLSPRVGDILDAMSTDVLSMDDQVGDIPSPTEDLDAETARLRVMRVSLWVLLATVLVALFGFIPSILVFMVVFYLVETDLGPWRSLAYAGLIWLGILIVFVEVLNTRFYGGVFDLMAFLPYP